MGREVTRARPTVPGWYSGPYPDEVYYLDPETRRWYVSTLALETPPAAYHLVRLNREGE